MKKKERKEEGKKEGREGGREGGSKEGQVYRVEWSWGQKCPDCPGVDMHQ